MNRTQKITLRIVALCVVSGFFHGCASYRTNADIEFESTNVVEIDPAFQIIEGDLDGVPYTPVGPVEAVVSKLTAFHKDPTKEQVNLVLFQQATVLGANAVIHVKYKEGVGLWTWGYMQANGVAVKTRDDSGQGKGTEEFNAPVTPGIMTTTDMRNLISGNTVSGKSAKGYTYHDYYSPDGTMTGRATSKYNTEYEDTGTWEINNEGQFCETWKKWRNHERNCYLTSVLEDGQYQMKAIGKPYEDILTIREGDPEGLAGELAAPLTQMPPDFNITGTYIANVTRENNSDYFCFNQKKTFQIDLKQENNIIKGNFLSGISGGIEGAMVGNKVKFNWYTARCSNLIEGEWTVSSDGSSLEGYGWSELRWKAQKQF
jgi:hypothetical protein